MFINQLRWRRIRDLKRSFALPLHWSLSYDYVDRLKRCLDKNSVLTLYVAVKIFKQFLFYNSVSKIRITTTDYDEEIE